MKEIKKAEHRAGRPELPSDDKRTVRIEMRVTKAEKQQLDWLCEKGNVTMTTLLLTGTLSGIDSLPQFQQLPADVVQQLTDLQRVASQLVSYAHRLTHDQCTQQQIRELVFTLGHLSTAIQDQVKASAVPQRLVEQLTALQQALREANPQTQAQQEQLRLVADVLKGYKPNSSQ